MVFLSIDSQSVLLYVSVVFLNNAKNPFSQFFLIFQFLGGRLNFYNYLKIARYSFGKMFFLYYFVCNSDLGIVLGYPEGIGQDSHLRVKFTGSCLVL